MTKRHPFIALAMGVAFILSGCEKVELENDNTNALTPEPIPLIRTEGLVAKKVCLDGVNYYATPVYPHMGPVYWSVGGAVFTKGSATPQTCEK